MLNAICDSGSKRETWFFLGVRNSTEYLMKEHLERLDREHENVHLRVCYSDPIEGDVDSGDNHHGERISVDLFKRVLPSNNYEFYICCPALMIESVTTGLKEWGVPDSDVHFEAFGPATVKKTKDRSSLSGGRPRRRDRFQQVGADVAMGIHVRVPARICGGKRHRHRFGMSGRKLWDLYYGREVGGGRLQRRV